MEGLQELANALSNGTIPIPYGRFFSKILGWQPPPKISIAINSGTGKATDFKFDEYIRRVHRTNSIKNLGEKGVWADPGTAQSFKVPLLSQERVKLRTSYFASTFIGSIETKVH